MKLRNTLGAIAGLTLMAVGSVASAQASGPIRVAITGSSDADFIAMTFGETLKELNVPVEYIQIDYTALLPALETGDLDVAPAVWDSVGWEIVQDAVNAGKIVNYGSTGVRTREGIWYPDYLVETCPGLPDWEALKEPGCIASLATLETEPRGRIVDAPSDWQADTQKRMDALGLDYEAVSSGSAVTMLTAIMSAVEKREPVLGIGFVPQFFFGQTPGDFVNLPFSETACYDDPSWGPNPDATFDCGAAAGGYVWKFAAPGLADKSAIAERALFLHSLDAATISGITDRIDNQGHAIEDVVADWIAANKMNFAVIPR